MPGNPVDARSPIGLKQWLVHVHLQLLAPGLQVAFLSLLATR